MKPSDFLAVFLFLIPEALLSLFLYRIYRGVMNSGSEKFSLFKPVYRRIYHIIERTSEISFFKVRMFKNRVG
jgi:hypothetical protein